MQIRNDIPQTHTYDYQAIALRVACAENFLSKKNFYIKRHRWRVKFYDEMVEMRT
jgi:hypothetical protein